MSQIYFSDVIDFKYPNIYQNSYALFHIRIIRLYELTFTQSKKKGFINMFRLSPQYYLLNIGNATHVAIDITIDSIGEINSLRKVFYILIVDINNISQFSYF